MTKAGCVMGKVNVRIVEVNRLALPWNIARDNARGWPCPYCWTIMDGKAPHPAAPTWDHVIPTSRGGPDHASNIVPACWECNNLKGDRDPLTWLGQLHATGMSPRRIKPLSRFIQLATDDLTEDEQDQIWKMVDDARITAEEAMDTQRRTIGTKLQMAVGSKRDKASMIMASYGFKPERWSWKEPFWVHCVIGSARCAIPFHGVEQFKGALQAEMSKVANGLKPVVPSQMPRAIIARV